MGGLPYFRRMHNNDNNNFLFIPLLDQFVHPMDIGCLCFLSAARDCSRCSFRLWNFGGGMAYLVLCIPVTALVRSGS